MARREGAAGEAAHLSATPTAGEGPAITIASLSLTSFRNLESAKLELPAQGIAIVGENGHGKTNFLEAIYYLHLLRSFRGALDVDVVQFGADGFHVAATISGGAQGESRIAVGFERSSRRKKATVDGAQPGRLSDAFGRVPTVMFSPRDGELVGGSPAERRRFLDVMLAAASRRYLHALQSYRSALQQRNSALRACLRNSGNADPAHVSVWEPPLAENGAILVEERSRWAEEAASRFTELCATIGEEEQATLRYRTRHSAMTDAALREALADALESHRDIDMRRGATSVGPHRDDLALELDGREMREFASAGQQRTAAIALRMLEASTLRDACGGEPILLLDDPFAELDARRSAAILGLLQARHVGQTFLCVPKAEEIPVEFSRIPRWRISGGKFMEAS